MSTPPRASAESIVIGALVAVVAIAAIVVVFVLPAETGVDPTGLGRTLGLTKIAAPAATPELERGSRRSGVLALSDDADPKTAEGVKDHYVVELAPYEAIELKYTLAKGATVVFDWRATKPVRYDMHAHPFEGGEALTESYSVSDAARMRGRYTAAFSGIHGWYWQNRNLETITLTLDASGAIKASTIFGQSGPMPRLLSSRK